MEIRQPKIAIIDSGLDAEHPRLGACKHTGIAFIRTETELYNDPDYHDEKGHGTAMAALIHRIAPWAELVIIKLSSFRNTPDEEMICAGWEWCLTQKEIGIINISLGVESDTSHSRMYELSKKSAELGIFICSAVTNRPGAKSFPAYFPDVIGITSGFIKNKLDYGFLNYGEGVNIVAKGTTQRVAWKNQGYKITSGNSYATAYFSGILSKLLKENPSVISHKERLHLIRSHATEGIRLVQFIRKDDRSYLPEVSASNIDGEQLFCLQKQFHDKIGTLALFPACEKEMKTLIEFTKDIPYRITKLYDYPRQFSFIKQPLHETCSRLSEPDFKEFDTIAIGYFTEQMFDANILFGYELIELAFKKNKNMITWIISVYDYLQKKKIDYPDYKGFIWAPVINKGIFNEVMRFKYLSAFKTPVVMVIGTSNKQGKITAQMQLKKILSQEGYAVSHISTEPQGVLLGADFLFPYGHSSTVDLQSDIWGSFLTVLMKGIEKYNKPNIIITGSQGTFVPRNKSSQSLSGVDLLDSLHYFCGIQPDGIVCAINPEDTIEQINNVIRTAQIFSKGRILFLIMNPKMRTFKIQTGQNRVIASHQILSKAEMDEKMEYFTQALNLPVIDIMDTTKAPWILSTIEKAFSN